MGRSRYPRRGHRLAPSTLRELLEASVPQKFLPDGDGGDLRLCDLDESSWERFGDQRCRKLAAEVVRAVGRAARMPMPIADRQLPPIPRGMKLADLDLEVRTANCLAAAGLHERPQDLRGVTIEGILGLRGFWVKCLVDLLTSLEYVNDHPKERMKLRSGQAAPIKPLRVSCRYPRPGHRLAPETLREILADPLPEDFAPESEGPGLKLSDLDEGAWNRFGPEEIRRLADLIVARVNASGYNRAVRQRRLPGPPKSMRLEDLRLENRTYNCLVREGFAKRPGDLGKRTVGDLLDMKAFGAKCLVDLLSSLETLAAREGKLDEKLTAEAEALARLPEAPQIHFSDPRLGGLLRAIDTEADTVAELVSHLLKRRLDPPDPLLLYEQICEVHRAIRELRERTLEAELMQIFSPVVTQRASDGRDREIVALYYGWDSTGSHTLEQLGTRYGLSRERIRQVCVRAMKRNRGAKVFAPVLDRVLTFIAKRLPKRVDELKPELDAAGFSACGLSLEAIRDAAGFLSREVNFELVVVEGRQLAVRPNGSPAPRVIVQAARRAVLSYGATTVGDVAAEVSPRLPGKVDLLLVEETLQSLADFEWLDRERGWFQ
ncbi:MAG: DNA-directed RNA polymerase subunit alpha C-terminal domain-containing protein, partial [Planctomycetota bacterium]